MFLVNKTKLIAILSNINIKHIKKFIKICDIDNYKHSSFNYVIIDLYIQEYRDDQSTIAHIKRDVYLINNL